MLRGSPQSEIDRHTYIPPQVAQSLNQHFNQSVPGHLKDYAASNASGYVSQGMEQAISREMQKNLPDHLKPYADAYVQQNVIQPIIAGGENYSPQPRVTTNVAAFSDKLKRDHDMPFGEQQNVELNTLPQAANTLFERPDGRATTVQQPGSVSPGSATPNASTVYDFIMQPPAPKKRLGLPSLPGLPPLASRLLVVLGGLLVLIILFAVFKSLLSGGSNVASLTAVVQDQTELLHIINNANDSQQSIGVGDQNALGTMQLAISSSDQQMITYLANNHHKLSTKATDLKISASTDQALTNAASSGSYERTLNQVLQNDLKVYSNDLSVAYKQTTGSIGRSLLVSDYSQNKLMLSQLTQAAQSLQS